LSVATAAPVGAADWPAISHPVPVALPVSPSPSWTVFAAPVTYVGELGMRFWFGRARTGKDLFDTTGGLLVSRLTYQDMSIFTGEAFGRFDFNTGWFLKGYIGGGGLFNGRLKDEDFPPVISPYSATLSDQRGSLWYATIDAGIKVIRGPDFHVGAFVGYNFIRNTVEAFGCGQIAGNPDVCGGGGVPGIFGVITQHNDWHSLRLGLEAAVDFDRRWRFAVDAAWLPFTRLYGTDFHWLRIVDAPGAFTGGIPEDGNGWGFQIDAMVNYRLSDWVNLGAGVRYWHLEARGQTHFEGHVVGFNAQPQVVQWRADHVGGFVQASIKFGPYNTISRN
jgi:hypothetical protein